MLCNKCNCMTTNGYDELSLVEFGWFKKEGIYINKYTENHLDKEKEYDWYEFDCFGIHKETKTIFDKNGFDWDGYDIHGV